MASSASPVTSLGASQRQKAEREGVGKGDGEEDLPAERWWLPQPGKPGVQLSVGCGGPSLVHQSISSLNNMRTAPILAPSEALVSLAV